jgi:alpha-1,3-rhamnosyl/mannosyltransferase
MLTVMIDATSLLLRSAGVKTYTYEWVRALREDAGAGLVRLFPFFKLPAEYHHEHSPLSSAATALRIAALHFGNISHNPAWNLLGRQIDLFHCSNQCHNPPQNTLLTATVHDMTCWLTPEFHSAANVKADAHFAERVLKRADGLIAVSENSRRDAIQLLGLREDRIVAIHPGVAPRFFDVAAVEVERVRAKLGLERPYVLSVGTIEPRKNTDRLLSAWQALPRDLRDAFTLVFAGPPGWASEATKSALKSGQDGVRYLGYVDEGDLAGLTAGAAVLAYPSLYEGFGLPVAQAMASGVAVMTSNLSSLPEVAGDAAEYADPRSVDSIRSALEKLLESPDLRRELGVRGRRRAEQFRWEVTAARTWEFWNRL